MFKKEKLMILLVICILFLPLVFAIPLDLDDDGEKNEKYLKN
tara:strand:+ start:238 stop:363 length:126 start_codon:yes stop_codon:yes gene_type:complete